MPHADTEIIRATKTQGMVSLPGVTTPTEAFAALKAGADALKLFPAELISPKIVKAHAGGPAARRPAAAGRRHLAGHHAGVS